MGDGIVTFAGRGVWFGNYGLSVVYRLLDGPAAGKSVYVSESCTPVVSVHRVVHKNTVVCMMHGDNYPWVETGWAAGDGTDRPLAHAYYRENATAPGINLSRLLQLLGAPGGRIESSVIDGHLPSRWPQWRQ